jgi:hypothetical protein
MRLILFVLIATALTIPQTTKAMSYSYNNSDLLLLFRSDTYQKDVEVDIGTVTNLLNIGAGASTNFSYAYNTNQVRTNFGTSYSTVDFTVTGVSSSQSTLWMTDFSDTSAPGNFAAPDFNPIRNQIETIGLSATQATGSKAGSNYVAATSSSQSYSAIEGGDYANFGGQVDYTCEALSGNTQNIYQFNNSGAGSAVLIGTVTMSSTTGVVSFTRASAVRVLVPANIVNVAYNGSSAQISFTTTNSDNYQLLYKTNLTQTGWSTNAATPVAGNNATESLTDTTASGSQRYYRVQSF